MSGARFSLRVLMVGVALVAVSIAAMRAASPLIANLALTVSVGVLLFGVVAAVCGRAEARGFWVGFSVFGFGYLLLSWGALQPQAGQLGGRLVTTDCLAWLHTQWQTFTPPGPGANQSEVLVWLRYDGRVQINGEDVDPKNATRRLKQIITDTGKTAVRFHSDPGGRSEVYNRMHMETKGSRGITSLNMSIGGNRPALGHFLSVGHSLLALVVGVVGGLMGGWLQVRNARREAQG